MKIPALNTMPVFSRNNLKLFLRGQSQAVKDNSKTDLRSARMRMARDLSDLTGVSEKTIINASAGRFITADDRTKIWAGLGCDPAAYGFRLIGTNEQEVL